MFFTNLPIASTAAAPVATFFEKGGPVMWPLLLCSLVTLAVALERLFYCMREFYATRRNAPAVEKAVGLAARGCFAEAGALVRGGRSCGARLLDTALKHRDMVLHEALETAALAEIDRLRRGLTVLDTIVTLAPMLGILGTVTGIISSFELLSSSGIQNPSAVTGGIAEALITTATGLVVAMLALVPYNGFCAHIRRRTRHMEQAAHLYEVACTRGNGNPGAAENPDAA